MARTQVKGTQLGDESVGRPDLNVSTAGQAVTRKIIAGTGVTISSTGVDAGTGDVTINAAPASSVNFTPVKVRTAAAQSVSANVLTKVVFGTVDYAPTPAAWVAASNRYVAQGSGIYTVKASVRITGSSRAQKLMLYKNGVLVQALWDFATTGVNVPFTSGSTDIQLAANDYLEIWFFATGNTTIASSPDCQFCARRVV